MWVGLHVSNPEMFPFKGYYVLDALKGGINPMSLCLSYGADKIPPEMRGAMFGWQLGTMSLAMIISAIAGDQLGPQLAISCAVIIVLANLLLIFFVLPGALFIICKLTGS